MDPHANISEQVQIARQIRELVESDVPWASNTEFGGDSDKWGDEQDRSEYFEHRADSLAMVGARLSELVLALHEWRRKGGYDPYGYERAESMTDEQLDQELIRTLSEQLRHLRGRFSDEGAAVIALDAALDRWDEFVALAEGGDE